MESWAQKYFHCTACLWLTQLLPIGRDTTTKTIQKCQEIGIEVVYGDTDSLFLKDPTEGRVEEVSKWARVNLGIDLELDKEYRYVVFSDLKKNYLGV